MTAKPYTAPVEVPKYVGHRASKDLGTRVIDRVTKSKGPKAYVYFSRGPNWGK